MTVRQHWKRCAGYFQAPFEFIERGWFGPLDQAHRALAALARSSTTARRMLSDMLPAPDPEHSATADMDDVPGWATWTAAAQRHLIVRIGAIACGPALRLAITRTQLVAIRRAIDVDLHREALDARPKLVETDLRAGLGDAIEADDVAAFFAAVGLDAISSTLPQRHRFLSFRIRYLFPRRAELDTELHCNVAAIEALIEQASGG